ncbi:fam-h protein [Plasmodium relictum]|uniref:Fam-h protein n=1 Tax=Plasmodium relictum TaxID=85471 RepID=A0A1J1GNL2_PLARL|nr:fam-h protein [Plasmodium relictum]CRG84321.1 fam-h protein [Plasmodium relictum]
MNMKRNTILNISAYHGLYSHVYKGYIVSDISTRKIYNKNEKKYTLNCLIKFFLFTLLIWILQCFNNWDSCKLFNYKNEKTNKLILGDKRLLAENNDKIKQKEKELKLPLQHIITETDLELMNEQREIEEYTDIEQRNEIEAKKEDSEVKHNEKKLGKYNNISKAYLLFFASILSFVSFLLSIVYCISESLSIYIVTFFFINLTTIIFSIMLILEEIKKKKHKIKL